MKFRPNQAFTIQTFQLQCNNGAANLSLSTNELGYNLFRVVRDQIWDEDDAGCNWATDDKGNTYILFYETTMVSSDPDVATLIDAANLLISGRKIKVEIDATEIEDAPKPTEPEAAEVLICECGRSGPCNAEECYFPINAETEAAPIPTTPCEWPGCQASATGHYRMKLGGDLCSMNLCSNHAKDESVVIVKPPFVAQPMRTRAEPETPEAIEPPPADMICCVPNCGDTGWFPDGERSDPNTHYRCAAHHATRIAECRYAGCYESADLTFHYCASHLELLKEAVSRGL